MKKTLIWLLTFTAQWAMAQSLDECQQAARDNYPLIKQYKLIEQTTTAAIDNIDKGWLPQISTTMQATLQNRVSAFPDALVNALRRQGGSMQGLGKLQYRLGAEISQTVYDGGVIRLQKEAARREGDLQTAQNDVTLYALRQRINDLYFGILLIDQKLMLNKDLQQVLLSNERTLENMFKGGTAAESDLNTVRAERLNVVQQQVDMESQRNALVQLLEAFTGKAVKSITKPQPVDIQHRGVRPEVSLINKQLELYDVQEKTLDTRLIPRLSIFASGYYGYTGYDMFHDMMDRKMTFNALVGARITWNIGALYTRKNDKMKLVLQRQSAEIQRAAFLFNNTMQNIQQSNDIVRYRKLMETDNEIIRLRTSVRKATESKLNHGIIAANDLIKVIGNENAARQMRSLHEIELLKAMYDLKITQNN